jgi:hypothetical protein
VALCLIIAWSAVALKKGDYRSRQAAAKIRTGCEGNDHVHATGAVGADLAGQCEKIYLWMMR